MFLTIVNSFLRFLLELAALISFGLWAWSQNTGPKQYLLAIGIPVFVAAIWGIFAVKNDPSRSGKTVVPTPGPIRFLFEILVFGSASVILFLLTYKIQALVFSGFVVLHYTLAYERVRWLFQQK